MYHPTFPEFQELCRNANMVPVYRQLLADVLTPVSAYSKVSEGQHAFLLESVVGGEKIGRYSFIGAGPFLGFRATRNRVTVSDRSGSRDYDSTDPMDELKKLLRLYKVAHLEGLPRFTSGAVGYFAYDVVRYTEDLPDAPPDTRGLPDICVDFYDTMVVFDHVYKSVKVVCSVRTEGRDPRQAYDEAVSRIDAVCARLRQPTAALADDITPKGEVTLPYTSNFTRQEFMNVVERCKEYIRAGDIFQVVPSQRLCAETDAAPFDIYRVLRVINPSPYMFYLELGDLKLVGASPEVMVRVEDRKVTVRPIAGTRPRGRTVQEDEALASELLADPKERAEHIMLVDLGRNDVGRVSKYQTVKVDECMVIERYSHVMHIVSNVSGELRDDKDAFDTLRACLPAGTLSGAPKVRAMEIIDEMESERRGPYGGAVGYIDFSGNMDTCITIRTIVMMGRKAYVQAGGGIVADSVPETEYEETLNKAKGLLRAIQVAEQVFKRDARAAGGSS